MIAAVAAMFLFDRRRGRHVFFLIAAVAAMFLDSSLSSCERFRLAIVFLGELFVGDVAHEQCVGRHAWVS